jgi:integrase
MQINSVGDQSLVTNKPTNGCRRHLASNRSGSAITRTNVAERLHLALRSAAKTIGSLDKRCISPHPIRHTTAMHLLRLLQSGVINVIALWLGHESPTTIHMYVEADLAMKDRAFARLQEPCSKHSPIRLQTHYCHSLKRFNYAKLARLSMP